MKDLILTEKPSVAKEIARVLGCTQKQKQYYEGPRHVVTWALGHLVTLAEPEDYDTKYKTWQLEDLPILPDRMKLKTIPETSHQFKGIQKLAQRGDLKQLIIATDAGREGELVARWIMERIRWRKPFKRLWISSQTDRAIKEGFASLRPGTDYDRLYQSAVSRAEADWLIGLNVTRALTCKFNVQLAAGRVQTPTLAMLQQREEQIRNFRSEEFRKVYADLGPFRAVWRDPKSGDSRLFDPAAADRVAARLQGGTAKVAAVQSKEKSEPTPLPYDLTELQRDANRRFGFSAKKTSNVLQLLYERHKLVTYPRTDSRHLSSDMVSTLKARLEGMLSGPHGERIRTLLKGGSPRIAQRVINNAKVTDHHAIIPTEERLRLADLSTDERQLYDLIAKRYLALFLPPFQYRETRVELDVNGERLHATGKTVVRAGWKELYGVDAGDDDADEADRDGTGRGRGAAEPDQLLPQLTQGAAFPVKRTEMVQGATEPPPRYTEAALLTQMEKHNLGTPATRADIIEKLLSTATIDRQGQRLLPTRKGQQLLELVAEELRTPELTAQWERELERIARGQGDMRRFLGEIRKQTADMVRSVKQSEARFKAHNAAARHCPECGELLQQAKSKRGGRLVCITPSCSYKSAPEVQTTMRRCPTCRKRMELHTGKTGKYVQCKRCNVVERLDDGKGGRRNKREEQKLVQQYSKPKQSFGNSLGDVLKQALEKADD